MFAGWSNYFFMVGSAAAALIGLMFIVATLTAGRDRSQVEPGKQLYTTPIVWHLGVVLVLSGATIAPPMTPRWFGLLAILLAVIGASYGIRIAVGIARAQLAANFSGYDMFWYGLAPALAYAALGVSAIGLINGEPWGVSVLAATAMALLLVSIHNEWDLVTFLAPDAPGAAPARKD